MKGKKVKEIVSTTSPNAEGEMLWCVHFKSSYCDNDPRGSDTIPVDSRIYVLAKSREEAISKSQQQITEVRKRCDKMADEKIEAAIVTVEDLIPARDSPNDGRIGWISSKDLSPIQLSCPEDTSRYRLAVCLVPV